MELVFTAGLLQCELAVPNKLATERVTSAEKDGVVVVFFVP